MRGILAKISRFIKEVQRAGDATKKRWLIIFSGAGMLIVIVLWIAYLNVTLPRTAVMPNATSAAPIAPIMPEENNPSFFKILGLGWKTVRQNIESGVDSLSESLGGSWLKFKERVNRTNDLNLENPAASPVSPLP